MRSCTHAFLESAIETIPGQRLGTPLLGAGHGGLGSVLSVDAMLGAIRTFTEEAPEQKLVVRFAVLEAAHARLVEHAADKHGVPRL
ncbi:MAG: hypothetical protein AAF645_23425 [Myxococcota bacterium]